MRGGQMKNRFWGWLHKLVKMPFKTSKILKRPEGLGPSHNFHFDVEKTLRILSQVFP